MGFNTKLKQAEEELLQFINSKIQMGIPHSVLGLLLENTLLKIEKETELIIQSEKTKVTERTIFDEKGEA